MTKMTYVNAINEALNGNLTEEVVEKLNALIVSLEKRNAHKSNKPTKAQKANEALKTEFLVKMTEVGKPMTASEVGALFGVSPQKASALLNQMAKAEAVVRATEKGKTLFSVA